MDFIEVGIKPSKVDSIGEGVRESISEDLGIDSINKVNYIEIYNLDFKLAVKDLENIAKDVLSDPVVQDYSINKSLESRAGWSIVVKYHDDVTDNVGIVAKSAIQEYIGKKLPVHSLVRVYRKYDIDGDISEAQVETICKELLANEVIESYEYKRVKE